jgi:uncharacterized protein YceK
MLSRYPDSRVGAYSVRLAHAVEDPTSRTPQRAFLGPYNEERPLPVAPAEGETMKKTIGRGLATAVLALLAGSSSGCMSMAGTLVDPVPYAGTQVYGHGIAEGSGRGIAPLVMTLDLPATMALDTALLPITIPSALGKGRVAGRSLSLCFLGCGCP